FITYHNALEIERYLRIAPELYLKRLIVGGFEAVFEINRNFRNEGMDHSHNPEFTMIEFYWAYHTYEDLIELSKRLFDYLLKTLNLDSKIIYNDMEVDFNQTSVISYLDALETIGGISKGILEKEDRLLAYLLDQGIKVEPDLTHGKLLAEAFDHFVEHK
ncbi:lysine--tRNA ligase, partial [Helicobacter pylori]